MDRDQKIIEILSIYNLYAKRAGRQPNGLRLLQICHELDGLDDKPLQQLYKNYQSSREKLRSDIDHIRYAIKIEGWSL